MKETLNEETIEAKHTVDEYLVTRVERLEKENERLMNENAQYMGELFVKRVRSKLLEILERTTHINYVGQDKKTGLYKAEIIVDKQLTENEYFDLQNGFKRG